MTQEEERQQALDLILASPATKKLVVAGPGTGKSHTFKALLETRSPPNLAITFINALALDLAETLDHRADTYTFHGFCKRLLHETQVQGLTTQVDYYPALLLLFADDYEMLNPGVQPAPDELAAAFHKLDDSAGKITACLASGNYYNSVGHDDSVFRVLRHLQDRPDAIPRFNQIVVDEYQDFNLLEVTFIEMLAQTTRPGASTRPSPDTTTRRSTTHAGNRQRWIRAYTASPTDPDGLITWLESVLATEDQILRSRKSLGPVWS